MNYAVGIDFGLKRTGIALSDSNQIIASPYETVNSTNLIEYLKSLNCSKPFKVIVLGFPKKLNGKNTDVTENVLLLKDVLKKEFTKSKIVLIDERFTSLIASRTVHQVKMKQNKRREKELIDKISASILLQDYLNQTK